MADTGVPEGVDTTVTDSAVSATAYVDAPPSEVFDYVRAPANHAAISGDETVRDAIEGPELLGAGDRFGAKMQVGLVPYRMTSTVVEFEQDRLIAWAHFGGHRWRWEIVAEGDGSRVTETYDQSTARFPPALKLMGYPKRHRRNVARSVANVAAHFAGG